MDETRIQIPNMNLIPQTDDDMPLADAPQSSDVDINDVDNVEAGVDPRPDAEETEPETDLEEMTGDGATEAERVAAARVDAARAELDEAIKAHAVCLKTKTKLVKPLTLAECNRIQKRVNLAEQRTRQAPINYANSRGMHLQPAPVSGRRTPLIDPNPKKGSK